MNPLHELSVHVPDDLHPDHAEAIRSLVSSAWHGTWSVVSSSPWIAIALMVPAMALLVRCTRLSLHRD